MTAETVEAPRSARNDIWALALLTVLALAVRLWQIGERSFWTDEAYTALVYTLPPGQLFGRLVVDDLHPPLYPLFVGVWARFFGTGELALRIPSALFGALVVPAVVGLARASFPGRLGAVAGWVAAGLAALSPLITLHAQEARNTTLVALEATVATWALVGVLERPSRRRWLLYGAAALALVYTHYVGFLVLAAHALYVASTGPRRLPRLALTLAAVGVLYLPWAPSAYRQLTQYRTYFPSTFSAPTVMAELASSYVSGVLGPSAIRPNLTLLGLTLAVLLAAGAWLAPRSWRGALLTLLVVGLPTATMLVVWSFVPKVNPRYLVAIAPAVYVLLGWAVGALLLVRAWPWRLPGVALLVATLGISVWGLPATYATERDDYRSLVAEIERGAGPNDAILALMELDEPVRYYYRGRLPVHHLVAQDDFATIAARLNERLAGRTKVWVVTLAEDWVDPPAFVRHALTERSQRKVFDRWYSTTHLIGLELAPNQTFTAEPAPAHRSRARFANGVELVGWDLAGDELTAGRPSTIDWHWRPARPDTPEFKVVVTVEDAAGRELARIDRTPATLIWGPPRWRVGEVVHGQEPLEVPAATPPGSYGVRFGIYDPATLKEIPAVEPDGRPLGTRVPAGEVVVRPSAERLPDAASNVARLPQPIDFSAAGQPVLRLLGFESTPTDPREGQALQVGLAWRALTKPSIDLEAVVRMKVGGRVVDEVAFPPVAGYPTDRWSDGALFVERRQLLLPPDVAGGRLELELGLRSANGPLAAPGGPFAQLATLDVRARPATTVVPTMQRRVDAQLGGAVRLLGYDLDPSGARPGGSLGLTLHWQALGRVERRQKVFVHLVDEREGFVGQRDAEPLDGDLPTTEWKPGEVVSDRHVVPIRPDAVPGQYRLRAGLYDAVGGQRLPVTGRDAGAPPTFVDLGTVAIAP